MAVEKMYQQLGGSITVIMKEGVAHHPHSLEDPTPIADWIEQHMHPVDANRPAFADSTQLSPRTFCNFPREFSSFRR
jgi:hypothetical protein